MPRLLVVGNDINIEGMKWMCVKECMLLGHTIEDNIPVLQGPDGLMINDSQFVRADRFKTFPKLGQTYTEIITLAEYESVRPKELEGKELKRVYQMNKIFIAICHDKTYVKFSAGHEPWDNDLTLDNECLTLSDLHRLDLISESRWERHLEEEQEKRMQSTARLDDKQFKEVARRIGEDRAKELLNNYLSHIVYRGKGINAK